MVTRSSVPNRASYPTYRASSWQTACSVRIPLREENEFRLTRGELEAAVTPKTKALLISFPNNPTGAVMSRGDLEAVAEVAREHNLIVISDEIYSELTYGEPHTSIASLRVCDRTIVIAVFERLCDDRIASRMPPPIMRS